MNSEEEVTKENPEVAYVLVRDDRKENEQRLISRRRLHFSGLTYSLFFDIIKEEIDILKLLF